MPTLESQSKSNESNHKSNRIECFYHAYDLFLLYYVVGAQEDESFHLISVCSFVLRSALIALLHALPVCHTDTSNHFIDRQSGCALLPLRIPDTTD